MTLETADMAAPSPSWLPQLIAANEGTYDTIVGNLQSYASGNWAAFMNPFSVGSRQISQAMGINSSTFPSGMAFIEQWPKNSTSVLGYNHLAYGNYDDTTVPTPITAKQISAITALTLTSTLRFLGDNILSNYTGIIDIFLCSSASNTGPSDHTHEIEIFLHSPTQAQSYVNGVTQIGTTTISGISWQVAIDNTANGGTCPDVLFMPVSRADVLSSTIDILAIFTYLIGQGTIANTEWFTGLGIGCESIGGLGMFAIDSISATYTHS